MENYRELTVEDVRETTPPSDSVIIDLKESVVSFQANKEFLEKHGVGSIKPGCRVLIKGKSGNSDMELWRRDAIEDIRLA